MVASETSSDIAWLRQLFSSIPRGLMIVDTQYAILNSNREALRMLRLSDENLASIRMHELLGIQYFHYVQNTQNTLFNQVITARSSQAPILVDFVPLIAHRQVSGFALVLQDLPSVESMAMELDSVRQLIKTWRPFSPPFTTKSLWSTLRAC